MFIPHVGNTNRIKPTFGVGVTDQIKIINNFMTTDALFRPIKDRQIKPIHLGYALILHKLRPLRSLQYTATTRMGSEKVPHTCF